MICTGKQCRITEYQYADMYVDQYVTHQSLPHVLRSSGKPAVCFMFHRKRCINSAFPIKFRSLNVPVNTPILNLRLSQVGSVRDFRKKLPGL